MYQVLPRAKRNRLRVTGDIAMIQDVKKNRAVARLSLDMLEDRQMTLPDTDLKQWN